MKKKIAIIVTTILIICILGGIVYFTLTQNKEKQLSNQENLNNVENLENIVKTEKDRMKEARIQEEFYDDVVITRTDIYNYDKLNDFIKYVNSGYYLSNSSVETYDDVANSGYYSSNYLVEATTETNTTARIVEEKTIRIITYTIEGDPIIKTVKYVPYTAGIFEFYKKSKIVVTDDYTRDQWSKTETVNKEYSLYEYKLKKTYYKDEENTEWIEVVFDKNLTPSNIASTDELPMICAYKLSSVGYKRNFEINFNARKDMGVDKIIGKTQSEKYDFDIYTMGGDVTITIDGDMVYDLKDALEQNVIDIDKILKQANTDYEFGVSSMYYYSDGGTTVYEYKDYELIKYNKLNGNKDFAICPAYSKLTLDEFTNLIYK